MPGLEATARTWISIEILIAQMLYAAEVQGKVVFPAVTCCCTFRFRQDNPLAKSCTPLTRARLKYGSDFISSLTHHSSQDGRRKEARPDREEAHQAFQPPPVRPLQMCRPKLEEAQGYRQPCETTI
nr:hypothetical protein CFP56_66500 [Quercus suber]